MTYDPEKMAPQKIDVKRIQEGLSKRQMQRIEYECSLLKVDIQKLLYIAPHLFNENITSANTKVIEDKTKETPTNYEDVYGEYYGDYHGI